ncbi:hypothetical protein SSX86_026825 [Deinandra increscens subsp. villosa]|uniref:H15 domain-containing protein n=1 Tax=Deinandra increscens subsp. villosa TaxID=3103831 RepID=A0AAP0GQH2_9ASTR
MSTAEPVVAATKKSKKTSAPKTKNPPLHPTYLEMIKDAIVTLKERNGSSPQAIAKFIEGKYKSLPANYKKLLSTQLKKNVVAGKLVKVKASFKLAPKTPAASAPAKKPAAKVKAPAKKKTVAAAKPKAKAPAAKAKTAAPKAKPAAKPAAPKAKAVAKPKAAAKAKAPVKPVAKSAKTSTRSKPGRTAAVKKTPVKKAPAPKKAAAKKTPVKKAVGGKKGKK